MVPLFLSLAPCPAYLPAFNTCSPLSRRLTNGVTPSCHPTRRKVIALWPGSIPTTPCLGSQEATRLLGTAGPGDLLVLSTEQQVLSKHIRLFMGILKVNLKFEVRRKAIVVTLFLLFKRNSF